jgi:hypothetical protein
VGIVVQLPADSFPEIGRLIDERHRLGLDTFDEWHAGVYVVVAGPSPEHGRIVVQLAIALAPLADAAGLHLASPANIGTDRDDCRVPDLAVFRPDTARTSRGFLATAEVAVEVLSPGERPRAMLGFYAGRDVREYLEVDPVERALHLWRSDSGAWRETDRSVVLDVAVDALAARLAWPDA